MTHKIDGFPSRELIVDGKRFLYFGGTAYLGLQTDSTFQNIHIKNIKKFGTNYGASRNANIQLSIYDEVERHLADQVGSEDCLTMSSGFLAGQLIARYFHEKGNLCFYAPNTHEALRLSAPQNSSNTKTLINDLRLAIEAGEEPVLFMDSISLDGENYPEFNWLKKLQLEKIILVADDSHGFGIIGKNGEGVFSALQKFKTKYLIVCGSLGKGYGIQGGFIAGSKEVIKGLKSSDMFAAASPAAPAALKTLLDAQKIISKKRRALSENVKFFLSVLSDHSPFDLLQDYPCFSFHNEGLVNHLFEKEILLTNFYYPNENGNLIQRIVLSSQHQKSDIRKLANVLNDYFGT